MKQVIGCSASADSLFADGLLGRRANTHMIGGGDSETETHRCRWRHDFLVFVEHSRMLSRNGKWGDRSLNLALFHNRGSYWARNTCVDNSFLHISGSIDTRAADCLRNHRQETCVVLSDLPSTRSANMVAGHLCLLYAGLSITYYFSNLYSFVSTLCLKKRWNTHGLFFLAALTAVCLH